MNVVSWTPFRDMEGIFDRYHRLLDSRVPTGIAGQLAGKEWDWRPNADISETKEQYLIKADLPEVDKDDVQVSVENGMLTISGERRFEKEEETETQHRTETAYGRFVRSFTLPSDVDEAAISAESKNGVLKVRLPKIAQKTPKPIEISVE